MVARFPRSDLEKIGDRLEQVEAILVHQGVLSIRLIAARKLLSPLDSTILPTRSMRKLLISILETMLRLNGETATGADLAGLLREIEDLRRAVQTRQADVTS